MDTISITIPRMQDVLIGRTGKCVAVDVSKYPQDVLSRIWDYGHKRRYNDHQSGWTKDTYRKEVKKDGTDDDWHTFLMETANNVRDAMYVGDWKEGGGASLPAGVPEMRRHIVATFKERGIELKVKVNELRHLDAAGAYASILIGGITKSAGIALDGGGAKVAIDSVVADWNEGVKRDLAVAKKQGTVNIPGIDDVVEELSS